MKVGIMGAGYVGLITGVGLASKGHKVICFDTQPDIVKRLNHSKPNFYESGLDELLNSVVMSGCLVSQNVSDFHLSKCEIIIIAVGTPSVNGKIDLSYINNAAEIVGQALKIAGHFISVIIKSTVIPGTTDTIIRRIIEETSGKKQGQFGLGMNPEFLREGNAIKDFMKPDRIIFGHDDPYTLKSLEKLYVSWDCDKIAVNTRTAEMIKYANNCLLATQISAVNELANIADAIGGIDMLDVMNGVHSDKRWNPILPDGSRANPNILSYLIPGCGFGGSCFPKDLQAIKEYAHELGVKPRLLDAVLKVNFYQSNQIITILKNQIGNLKDKKILILGLSFKPDTDDIRESVSLKIIKNLINLKAQIIAHDPMAMKNAKKELSEYGNVRFTNNWKMNLGGVDAIIIATKWSEYKQISSKSNIKKLDGKIILDARRFFDYNEFPNSIYLSVGRTN